MLDSLEMSQSSSPSGKKNESNFRKDKPIFSPHQQSHNTMIITSNDNRQLIYIILHNQCPSLWASFIFPISDLCGRGKFHCSIFQKHANGPSTGHPDVNSHTFFQNRSQNTEQSPMAPDYLAPLCSGTDTVLISRFTLREGDSRRHQQRSGWRSSWNLTIISSEWSGTVGSRCSGMYS